MVLPGGRWEGELCAPVSHKGATKAQGLLQVSLTWKQLKDLEAAEILVSTSVDLSMERGESADRETSRTGGGGNCCGEM